MVARGTGQVGRRARHIARGRRVPLRLLRGRRVRLRLLRRGGHGRGQHLTRPSLTERGQGRVEPVTHHHRTRRRDDDPLQLGQRTALRLDVQRLHVQDRILQGDHQQVPTQYL